MLPKLVIVCLIIGISNAKPQQQQEQHLPIDYDYLYDDLIEPNFAQNQPRQTPPRAQPQPTQRRQPQQQQQPAQRRPQAPRPPPPQTRQQNARDQLDADVSTTTFTPILKDSRRTDPITGAFIYDYLGGDGQAKYEVRFTNGTVLGNYTFINEFGEPETRWYSAGVQGTEISGDGNFKPSAPLVDETTDPNYIDLSNYELYRHLEEPYVHIAGPSDPDERGQLSNPERNIRIDQRQQQRPLQQAPRQLQQAPRQLQQAPRQSQQGPRLLQQAPRPAQPSPTLLDHGDDLRFVQQQQQQQFQQASQPRRVARVRSRAPAPAPRPAPAPISQAQFNAGAIVGTSPDSVLDSLINQFQ